jgi:polyisoprenoid-binding protein YceI
MKLKWSLIMLATVGLTAAFTYLLVSNHYLREQSARWQAERDRSEAERNRLEYELALAQEQVRTARLRPPSLTSVSVVTNAPRTPPPPPPARPPDTGPTERTVVLPPGENTASVSDGGLAPVVGVFAQRPETGWARYVASPTGSVCLIVGGAVAGQGESRDWKIQGHLIAGYFEHDARFDFNQPVATMVRQWGSNLAARAEVSIPVRSLKSQAAVAAGVMDNRMQQALNARNHPNLEYTLTSLTWEPSEEDQGKSWPFTARGQLRLHGVSKDWTWPGLLEPISPDRLRISVTQRLRMSDFNVSPPAFTLVGVPLQTEDAVTVYLTWTLMREIPTTAAR